MSVTIDVFKKAFAGKVSPDLVSQRDQQVTAALIKLSQAVKGVATDSAMAKDFNEVLLGLVQTYDKLKKSNGPTKELLSKLDGIRQQATSKASEVADWVRNEASNGGEPKYATGLDIEPKYATGLDIEKEPGADAAAEPKTGMAAPFEISAAVGKGGKNLEDDVSAVQVALNRRMQAGLSVDGKCSPQTIKAIIEFQKALGQSRPDGRVVPGGEPRARWRGPARSALRRSRRIRCRLQTWESRRSLKRRWSGTARAASWPTISRSLRSRSARNTPTSIRSC